MNTGESVDLTLAGRTIPGAADAVRRYCGLPWSGGPAEVWAYAYYDAVPTDRNRIEPTDVTATAALHPGPSRTDLEFFVRERRDVEAWLAEIPTGVELANASDDLLNHLERLAAIQGVSLALLTKVLHRKRPELIPLVDRHLVDLYRPITGERSPALAWPRLLIALRADLAGNGAALEAIAASLRQSGLGTVSAIRIADIAVWMGARP